MEQLIPPAVVFDCDGTLVDSELIHAKALQGALAGLGLMFTPEQIRSQSVGVANADFLSRVAEERGLTFPANLEAIVEDKAFQLIADELKPMEGTDQVVRWLTAQGVKLALASNSSQRLVRQMLSAAGLDREFGDRIVTSEDVAAPKPAPDLYRLAASLLSARTDDCLAVEDSPVGVTAARRAGMPVVGFCPPSGTFGETELTRAGAFAVIRNLRELLGWPLRRQEG